MLYRMTPVLMYALAWPAARALIKQQQQQQQQHLQAIDIQQACGALGHFSSFG